MTKQVAYIGIGSNLGDRKDYINKSVKMLGEVSQIEFCRLSDIIETAALGNASEPDYLNAVAEITTSLNPEELHAKTIEIENTLGRERKEKWSSRTIDLDILLFDDLIINTTKLTIPHSQMHLRSFVLKGLSGVPIGILRPDLLLMNQGWR